MIREIPPSFFRRVEPIFQGPKQYIPVHAVLQGAFPGKVYAVEAHHPTAAVVWALTRWAYVDGDPRDAGFLSGLPDLMRGVIFPLSRQMGKKWFELYSSPSARWMSALDTHLSDLHPSKHYESTFSLDMDTYAKRRQDPQVPAGMELQRREFPIVSEAVRSLSFMPQASARRTSVGFQLVSGNRTISVCRSNGLAAGDEFMIDAETAEASDRSKGYARMVATALVDDAIRRGLFPFWETTKDNTASRRLAQKLGFVEIESYPVYVMGVA